jgi:hypothetical protein
MGLYTEAGLVVAAALAPGVGAEARRSWAAGH